MSKSIFLVLAMLLTFLLNAQQPISLTNSNMPNSGDTLRYTNVQLSSLGNYTATGTNYNWNFSSVVSGTSGVRSYISALLTPYVIYFAALNEYGEKVLDNIAGNTGSITISNYYNFYKKSTNSPNAFLADGVGITISGVPVGAHYSDRDELYNFPLTYPRYDSTTFRFATPTTSLLPIIYSRTGSRATRVDGWGTITTPYGTDNCIRLVTTQYSNDTLAISLSTLIPVPVKLGFVNNQRSYQWFTTSSKIPFFEVTGTLLGNTFTPTQVRYRGYDKSAPVTSVAQESDISAMNLYPNPVKDKLWLSEPGGTISSLEVLDVNGRFIRKANAEAYERVSSIDVSDLATGLYVIKFTREKQPLFFKFIKE